MKKFKFLLVLFTLLLFITSCENEETLSPDKNNTALQSESNDFESEFIGDLNLMEQPILSDATEYADFILLDDGMPEYSSDNFEEESFHFAKSRFLKKRLFTALKLTDLQKRQLHKEYAAYKKCKYYNYSLLRKMNQEIIAKANKEKQAIIIKYKKKLITKVEMEKALKTLHARTIYVLKNNAARKQVIENLKKCHKEFLQNIKLVLTKDQWELWIKWHQKAAGSR